MIASGHPATARALSEQLLEAGYTCLPEASESAITLRHEADMLYLAARHDASEAISIALPVRLSELLAQLSRFAHTIAPLHSLTPEWSLSVAERTLKHSANTASIALTEKECAVLAHLLATPDRSAQRTALLENVWGYGEDISTHTLETHVYRLRTKLSEALGTEWLISTDSGYRIAL